MITPQALPIATSVAEGGGYWPGESDHGSRCGGVPDGLVAVHGHLRRTVAPEATYQAWLAHFLMEQVEVLRVVREVDFGSQAPAARTLWRGTRATT